MEKHKKQFKNNKLNIIALTRNDEFELPDGSYSISDIQDYIEYVIKKHTILTKILHIPVYINRINNRLVFKIKDGYNLELETPKKMKLFGSAKNLLDKTKNGENVLILEVVEIVLIKCNSTDNQYQQKSEVLYIFTPNKSYGYLLNVQPNSLVYHNIYGSKW